MHNTKRNPLGILIVAIPLLLLVLFLNGINNNTGKEIKYTELEQKIAQGEIKKAYIKNQKVYLLRNTSLIAEVNFPAQYDYQCAIGSDSDFVQMAKQAVASSKHVEADDILVSDLGFSLEYGNTEKSIFLTTWLPVLIPTVVLVLLWLTTIRSLNENSNRTMAFGRSKATLIDPARNTITFADVAGAKEEKEQLEEIVDFLKNPKRYRDLGARIPKGVLMVGPPGTGKTLLAKAVAGEAKVPFFSISGSDFVEMFVGMGASRVRDLFEQARKNAPCIVFIDEIDAVGRHRGAGLGGGHDEREQTLNQLLVEMDGFKTHESIIVLAATNRRDILDPALLRPGRFDRQVTVSYPDLEGRIAILNVHAKDKPLAADVDLESIAKRTPYATGADMRNIMNEGAIAAARENCSEITMAHLVEAVERIQMGPEKKSHKVLEEDRRITAIHEAGHAVVGHYLEKCDDIELITIIPRGQAGGFTLSLPEKEYDHVTRSQMLQRISMILGGRAAERIVLEDFSAGAVSDLKQATDIARNMVTRYGMSEELGHIYLSNDQEVFVGMEFGQSREYSENTAAAIDREVKKILDKCYLVAEESLRKHAVDLKNVAEQLIEKETMDRKAFLACLAEA